MNILFVYLQLKLITTKKYTMKVNEAYNAHLGNNIKHLMKAFQITQAQLADKLDTQDSHLCTLLQKPEIDDETLQKIADAIGHGVTAELIRNYSHDDTIKFITNNYTQNVENGGTGTLIPNQDNQNIEEGGTGNFKNDNSTTFQEGSSQNNYVAEQAFVLAEKNTKLEKLLLYYRMKVEPEVVEKEMELLKKDSRADGAIPKVV